MKPAETIENQLKRMNMEPAPPRDRQILQAVLRAQAQANSQTSADDTPKLWRIMMHSKLTKPIAAAIVIAAGLVSLTLLNQTVPPAYAVEQTVEAMQHVRNLRLTVTNGTKTMEMLMRVNPQTGRADHIRLDDPDSAGVTITVPGQTYRYDPAKNQVTLLPQELLTNDLNFRDVINSVIEQTRAADGHIEITNAFSDLAGKNVIEVTLVRKDRTLAGQFLIDPETSLPLYIAVDAGGQLNYMGPIEYNVEFPDNAFEFDIPDGAAVIDHRPDEMKTQSAESSAVDYDIAQTAFALRSARNVHGIWTDRKGRRVNSWALLNPADGTVTKARLEYEDGGLYIMADGRTYFDDHGFKGIKDELFFNVGLLFKDFITFAAQNVQEEDSMTVEKAFSDEFQREMFTVKVRRPWVHLDAVIDPETRRPVKLSIPWTSDPTEPFNESELIEYDVDIPDGFFDFPDGPDVLTLGKHLDTQYISDPNYGMAYDDTADIQHLCRRMAERYLRAKIELDIDTIKQLHSAYVSRIGSDKMIEKSLMQEIAWNGRIVEVLEFESAYEYRPRQMMVPCRVVKEHNGTRSEMYVGVIVYLRQQNGQKSAVITGYFPRLSDKLVNPPGNAGVPPAI